MTAVDDDVWGAPTGPEPPWRNSSRRLYAAGTLGVRLLNDRETPRAHRFPSRMRVGLGPYEEERLLGLYRAAGRRADRFRDPRDALAVAEVAVRFGDATVAQAEHWLGLYALALPRFREPSLPFPVTSPRGGGASDGAADRETGQRSRD